MKVKDKLDVLQKHEITSKKYCDRCKQEITITDKSHRVTIYVQTPSSISPFDILHYSVCTQCRKDLVEFIENKQ